jgi:hypothetical protein
MMTAKFLILNVFATETHQGQIRMQATRDQHLFAVLREFPKVLKRILETPATLFTAGLMVLLNICWMINGTFWSILVTEKLQIPPQHLPIYHVVRSMTMLGFFFLVMPRLRSIEVRKPLLFGIFGLIATQIVLISTPVKSYLLLLVATVLEGCSVPIATTLLDKLTVIMVEAKERARIMAILYAVVIVCTSPFGWIAGELSQINRSLPFVLNIILLSLAGLLTYLAR